MDSDDFQCVQVKRGLNTNGSNPKFTLPEDDNVRILLGIMHGYDEYACNMIYAF